MKKSLLLLIVAAVLALGAAQAFARSSHTHVATKLSVVMHDPGCHSFSYRGKLETKLALRGAVQLMNLDEATLKIVGPAGSRFDRVGKTIVLGKGTYRITMVGQAPDDNHLKLVIS